ncbi:ATP-binding protein [Pseudomonas sp. NPDC089401]|uniref:ATP-binding protein n=1 Tax=Pseudomonas sp. NPDC089401 TaxID=3364462 RepID=UPI003816A2FD
MEPSQDEQLEPSLSAIAFGPFQVVPGARRLTREGAPVAIGGRAFDLLLALLEQPGRVVSKRELLKRVWPDQVVEEGSLRFHMTGLRRTLGDGEDGARYIDTQVGVGYAFVAPLARPVGEPPAAAALPLANGSGLLGTVGSLPPRAQLIGRDADVAQVCEHLLQPRLFTIVGPGGVGKTSLAVEIGHRLAAARDGAVRFVDLAQVEDAGVVPSAIAGALGIPVQAEQPLFVLLAHLRGQRLLLLIDNCEHLVDAVSALVEQIREAAPGVAILATSREPLRALGEHLHRLEPLAFPAEHQALGLDELLAFPAIRLFVERALSGNTGLTLSTADARLIGDICQRLEGMALPIELAAMRVASHGVQATHTLLGERFSLGWSGRRTAQPRHQTLRAMFDWSYGLLAEQERLVFDRLAVFVGPFSLQAASQIVADQALDPLDAAASLDQLCAKGLVTVECSDALASYRLLEMTRAYAREKLLLRGPQQAHALAFRHAAYHTELLGQLRGTPQQIFNASARLGNQLGNVRSALEWSFGPHGDPGLALPLAAASTQLFLHFALLVECRTWCARATELLQLGYFGTPTEMELQAALGLVLMFTQGNNEAARQALHRALEIAEQLDDRWSQLRLLGRLQIFYERIGDFAASLHWAEQAVEVAKPMRQPEATAVAASLAGIAYHLLGKQGLARQTLEVSLRNSLPSERSSTLHYGFDHRNRTGLALARTLWLQGYPDQARQGARQVEREALALDHAATYCIALVWTLHIDIWSGDLDNAEQGLQAFAQVALTNAFAPYVAAVSGIRAAIDIRAGRPANAVAALEEALARLHGMRYELLTSYFEIALAEGLIQSGEHAKALAQVEHTIRHCHSSGDAFALPELLRLKATIQRALAPQDHRLAQATLEASLALSDAQGSRSWALRSALDLAELWRQQGRLAEARQLLEHHRAQFSEGFDTHDLRQLDLALQRA